LIKIDASGNLVWQKPFGGTVYDELTDIIELSNGDYLLVGRTTSSDGDVTIPLIHHLPDTWLIKIDKNGTILWQKIYGGTESDYSGSIIPTADGAFLLSGISHSNDVNVSGYHGSGDAWLFKTRIP
jgi:hypothetical protein